MPDTTKATVVQSRFKRWFIRLSVGIGLCVILGAGFVGVAEHETAKPEFCGSCHIMESYHESWRADLHGGKLEVACVECHYAPGERTTVNAKLRGLSQLASYVSGRYGATRPRAHVSNDSCMTSKCHGDRKFMDRVISLGTVQFTHASHLAANDKRVDEIKRQLDALSQSLKNTVGEQRLTELVSVARESGASDPRIDKMEKLVREWKADIKREDLQTFSQLHHREVRFLQLMDIQCTNCHVYASPVSPSGGRHADKPAHHFTVNTNSCFTCHFNNEGFNTGTNSCLMCHKLPTGDITIHPQLTAETSAKLETPELAKKAIRMNHEMILKRKVNCISCHADVASEDSLVTQRDCERCHDQPRYFENWKEPFSLELVSHYHRVHVPDQRAKCLDCHSEIHHQLVKKEQQADVTNPAFMSSVMANCTHCHPQHHADQLKLLSGVGGSVVHKSDPNMMFGSRTNCYGCHTEATMNDSGQVLRASLNGCVACHGDLHNDTFEQWKHGLEVVQIDADEAYAKARKLFDESATIPDETRKQVVELLDGAKQDLHLVKQGNGMHNVTFAMELLDSVTTRSQQALRVLDEAKSATRKSPD